MEQNVEYIVCFLWWQLTEKPLSHLGCHKVTDRLCPLVDTVCHIYHFLLIPPHTQHNCFTAFFGDHPGWAGARRELLDFMVQGKINSGRHTDHPAGRHSIWTNHCSPPTISTDTCSPIITFTSSNSLHIHVSTKRLNSFDDVRYHYSCAYSETHPAYENSCSTNPKISLVWLKFPA